MRAMEEASAARAERQTSRVVDDLLAEFNARLQTGGPVPPFEHFVNRCPEAEREVLTSLMNTLVLTDKALAPLRRALAGSDLGVPPEADADAIPVTKSGTAKREQSDGTSS